MKFHHFGQLLLDSNCLLLILKMFGLQEVSTTVVAKNESPDHKSVPVSHILVLLFTVAATQLLPILLPEFCQECAD